MTIKLLNSQKELDAWLTKHESTGYLFTPRVSHPAKSHVHLANCSHARWKSGRTTRRFGAITAEELVSDMGVRGFLPMHGYASVCRLCEQREPGLSERVHRACARWLQPDNKEGLATVILSTDATSDGEAVPEFTSVPRTRDIFRPIAEFEGVKSQTVEASTRMVHVEHGVLTNLLDATIRKYLPEHCVTEQNGNVDIAIRRDGKVLAIFECKSNPGNISDALYKGIGQLFVYRCLLKVPQAKLALVLPNKLTSDRKTHTEIMDELGIEVFYGDSEGNFESPRGYALGDWLANVVLAGTAKD